MKIFIALLLGIVVCGLTGCDGSSGSGSPPPVHNKWTWMGGADIANQRGSYGTLGVAAQANLPGGRYSPVSWIAANGNLWLFGGYSWPDSADLNDLWKYSDGQWEWMGGSNIPGQPGVYGTKGVADPANIPGARDSAVSWIDPAGNFWLFGGTGIDSTGTRGELNDLWKYSNGEWTWMSGSNLAAEPGLAGAYQGTGIYGTKGVAAPGNLPGARFWPSAWVDPSGNFWLFGGEGVDANGTIGDLNDLWKYSNGEWTWMSGLNIADKGNGIYGTLGVPSPENAPGDRAGAATWVDAEGNLWLFGGDGADAQGCQDSFPNCELGDLWKYSNGEWTWMGGSSLSKDPGVYGTQGVAAPGNTPLPRSEAVSWTDAKGNFWLYGGTDATINLGDLWKYSNGQWTWVSGSNSPCPEGSYGSQGIASAGNTPGARSVATGWADKSGNLWLFGGENVYCGSGGTYNDLWRYQP